jgi:protein-disulfide isomerase-like protein with CxxC motif
MSAQLFYLYDTHCPWSYATLPLVNEIVSAYPEIELQLLHCARYEGDENISKQTIEDVEDDSTVKLNETYLQQLKHAKDSTLAANLMAWVSNKVPHIGLEVLNGMFEAHFTQANEMLSIDDMSELITEFKLSPPNKVFTIEKLTKDAELSIHGINELQEIIGTQAIPAILLAVDENLILLNHNLYLKHPKAIVEAVKLELAE